MSDDIQLINNDHIQTFNDVNYEIGKCFNTPESYEKLIYLHNNLQYSNKKSNEYMMDIIQLNKKIFYKTKFDQHKIINTGPYKILRIYISNLLIFGENNYVDFTKLNGFVHIDAPNRTGKSSLIEVINFILYARTSKSTQCCEIINLNSDGKMFASMDIEKDGNEYRIIRMRQAGKKIGDLSKVRMISKLLILNKETKKYEVLKLKNLTDTVDKQIESLFGSYQLVDSILSMSNDKKTEILDMKTNCEIYDYFAKIFNLDIFKELTTQTNKKILKYKSERAVYNEIIKKYDIDTVRNELKAMLERLEIIKKNKSKYKIIYKNLSTELLELQRKVTNETSTSCNFEEQLILIKDQIELVDDINDKINSVTEINKKQLLAMNDNKNKIKQVIEKIVAQTSDMEITKLNIKELQKQVEKLSQYNKRTDILASKFQVSQNDLNILKRDFEHSTKILQSQKALLTNSRMQESINILNEEIQMNMEQLNNSANEIKFLNKRIDELNAIIESCEVSNNKINEINNMLDLHHHYLTIISRNAIPYLILEHYLPYISLKMNETISIFGGKQVKFELIMGKSKGRIDQQVPTLKLIKDTDAKIPAKTSSGGEGFWTNLGMRLALYDLFNRSGYQFICLDESLHSLDKDQIGKNLLKIFDCIRAKFNLCVVVSHRKSISKKCTQVVSIRSQDLHSYINCADKDRTVIKREISEMIKQVEYNFKSDIIDFERIFDVDPSIECDNKKPLVNFIGIGKQNKINKTNRTNKNNKSNGNIKSPKSNVAKAEPIEQKSSQSCSVDSKKSILSQQLKNKVFNTKPLPKTNNTDFMPEEEPINNDNADYENKYASPTDLNITNVKELKGNTDNSESNNKTSDSNNTETNKKEYFKLPEKMEYKKVTSKRKGNIVYSFVTK